jgi:TonB family protein
MKTKLLTFFLLFNIYQGLCQDTNYVKYKAFLDDSIIVDKKKTLKNEFDNDSLKIEAFDDSEFCIQFPGGDKALREYLAKNLQYPTDKNNSNIEGKVYASFTINEKGKVENVKIERSLNEIFDKEVIRVISSMPNWKWNCKEKPNYRYAIRKHIPITFKTIVDRK